MSITVEKLSKHYGNQKAVNEASFSISKGEIVGFLGPNGAGKSTTMKMLTCFIPQTSGKAKVNGFDINEESMKVRKSVGYLPEHNPLYLDMYVKEYLSFTAKLQGLHNNRARVKEIIAQTGLELEQRKKIGALSKGYRQRVGLAQALIHNPEVLILDEPTSGLDPNQIEDIRDLIKQIGKEKTVMLSTHIMQEVEAICSRVIIINKGNIVADDATANLKQGSQKRNIYQVDFSAPVESAWIQKLDWIVASKKLSETKWKLETEKDISFQEKIFQFAVDNKMVINSMIQEENSLEKVFQNLTKK